MGPGIGTRMMSRGVCGGGELFSGGDEAGEVLLSDREGVGREDCGEVGGVEEEG